MQKKKRAKAPPAKGGAATTKPKEPPNITKAIEAIDQATSKPMILSYRCDECGVEGCKLGRQVEFWKKAT